MTPTDFIESVRKHDFSSSGFFLQNSLRNGTLSDISSMLKDEVEKNPELSLPVRDHIFYFVHGFPIYAALRLSAFEILELIAHARNQDEAVGKVVSFCMNLLRDRDPCLMTHLLEIEELAEGPYSVFIHDLLTRRVQEFGEVRVPSVTVSSLGSKKYYIRPLYDTSYGWKLLATLGIRNQSDVVGISAWIRIADALADLGVDEDDILVKVDEEQWRGLIPRTQRRRIQFSAEMIGLQNLQAILYDLHSPDERVQLESLRRYQTLDTIAYLSRIASLLSLKRPVVQSSVLEILGEKGDARFDAYLTPFLESTEQNLRIKAARAISLITSRGSIRFQRTHDIPSKERDRGVEDLIRGLSGTANKAFNLDAAKAILTGNTIIESDMLTRLYLILNHSQKKELLNILYSMRRENAMVLLGYALRDPDLIIQEMAKQIAHNALPDEA